MKKKIIITMIFMLFVILNLYQSKVYGAEEGDSKITKAEETEEDKGWSDAKVTIESSDAPWNISYQLNISNVKSESKHTYYYFIGDGKIQPEFSTNLLRLSYNENNSVFFIANISEYLELASEQYLYVYDYYLDNDKAVNNLVLDKVKLQKPEQKQYTDVFKVTFIAKDRTQIVFANTPWGSNTTRNIHFKVGKISNDTILKDIYDKKMNAFENLLNYAKNATAFYDKTVKSNEASSYILDGELFPDSEVSNNEYYFLYAVLENENGKYVKTEGVTLARCYKSSINNWFSLNFYGGDSFSWKDFTNGEPKKVEEDPTKAPWILPDTGIINILLFVLVIAIVMVTITYRKYKKYNFKI